ncbi:MAG: SLBB domain-containing protein [Candidatus Delongbacteria bacterium]|nr:SLBB domain-containing protein [Candidatus Delongbacteria bacterium]
MKRNSILLILFLQFVVLQTVALAAIGDEVLMPSNRAAEYFLGSQDELLIKVNVWGRVLKPGQYNIPSGTNLIELLSAAGGPAERARLSEVRLVRNYHDEERIININIKRYLKTGNPNLIPELMPGDTVIVSGSVSQLLASSVQVFYQLSIILNVYYLLSRNL